MNDLVKLMGEILNGQHGFAEEIKVQKGIAYWELSGGVFTEAATAAEIDEGVLFLTTPELKSLGDKIATAIATEA